MQKIAYITVKTPFSKGETFILTEMLSLKEMGADLLIIPRDKSDDLFHKEAEPLLNHTLSIPRLNFKILNDFFKFAFMHPLSFLGIFNDAVLKARSLKVSFKNFVILPKSIYLSTILKQQSVSHIHAHWASTTSTMAYIASRISGIPWSFTAHRWDISENNILKEKCKAASFVRVINENGKEELIGIIKDSVLAKKISVIHMGVVIPKSKKIPQPAQKTFTILCPANLVYVKGHRYLFEACKILSERMRQFKCLIAGDGPLREELETIVKKLDLNGRVEFLGRLPHDRLLQLYGQDVIHAVVLPSIETEEGAKEGTPVALIEAMAYGIPVISTDTGGISKLIGSGSGIMVNEKDSGAIAEAIENLMEDMKYYDSIGQRGREKIEEEFNISLISQKLMYLFSNYT